MAFDRNGMSELQRLLIIPGLDLVCILVGAEGKLKVIPTIFFDIKAPGFGAKISRLGLYTNPFYSQELLTFGLEFLLLSFYILCLITVLGLSFFLLRKYVKRKQASD